MCPKPNYTASALSKKSHVEDLPSPIPSLFEVLTSEPDREQRWLTFTYPVDFDLAVFKNHHDKQVKYRTRKFDM